MIDFVFRLTQLTTSVATILGSAYVWVNSGSGDGFFFFIFGALFTIVLRFIEQGIFADNVFNGRYWKA